MITSDSLLLKAQPVIYSEVIYQVHDGHFIIAIKSQGKEK